MRRYSADLHTCLACTWLVRDYMNGKGLLLVIVPSKNTDWMAATELDGAGPPHLMANIASAERVVMSIDDAQCAMGSDY